MKRKNLEQRLTAQGLSGGASESAMASLLNPSMAEIVTKSNKQNYQTLASAESSLWAENLASLLSGLQSATSSAEQARLSGTYKFGKFFGKSARRD